MFQVKALCEKAKEILMEESNVQVPYAGSLPLTVVLGIFHSFTIGVGGYLYCLF